MEIEVGSYWLCKTNGSISVVKNIFGNSCGKVSVAYTGFNKEGFCSFRETSEYNLFIRDNEQLVTQDDLNKEYVKGKTDGYGEGYQHGFTLAKEKITELDKSDLQKQYNKGFEKGSDYVREYTKQNELLQKSREEDIQKLSFNDGYRVGKKEGYESGYADCSQELYSIFGERELEIEKDAFQEGYAQAYSELHAPTTEQERQLQEKAWDEGYVSAIEDYLAQGGEFIGNVSCYEFGAVADLEHTPNKETQGAMQEVLDKSIINKFGDTQEDTLKIFNEGFKEFLGTWVANDGSCKLKVLSVNGDYCDVELLELDGSESYLFVGDIIVIDLIDLKDRWTKEKKSCEGRKHSHYYKDVRHLDYIDVYQVNKLFPVKDDTDCILHARKKLLVCGGRGGGKDMLKDVTEAYDTLKRYLEIEGHLDD